MTTTALALAAGGVALGAFGLPPVDLHAPPHFLGVMDPLCGMTRAAHALALARFGTAWSYNPGIFLVALGTAAALARAVVGATTKHWFDVNVLVRRPVVWGFMVLVAALWVNQQLHASLLTAPSGT